MHAAEWISLASAVIALISLVVSIKSNAGASQSAKAAERSAVAAEISAESSKISSSAAIETLEFERKRNDSVRTEQIISAGINFFRDKSWPIALERWLFLYPELPTRNDFFSILARVGGASGVIFNSPQEFIETAKKQGVKGLSQ